MTPNIGVCSQGHAFLVDHSLNLTGPFNRVMCPECLSNDRHHFLYSAEKHPHLLSQEAPEIEGVSGALGPINCGAIGACGQWLNSLMACIECGSAVSEALDNLE